MNKYYLLLCFFSCWLTDVLAQEAIIYGHVEHPTARTIRYSVSLNRISGDEVLYEVELNEKNNYAITLDLNESTIVKMFYNQKEMWVYLWPMAYLEMNFSAHNYYQSFQYDGDASAENTYLAKFIEKFGLVNPYDAATIFPALTIPNDIYEKMHQLAPNDFTQYTNNRKKLEEDFDATYPNKKGITPDFLQFMKAHRDYRWAGYMLAYTEIAPRNGHSIPDTFSMFLFDLDIENEKVLESTDYIAFLEEYLKFNYQDMKGDTALPTDKFELFGEQYALLDKILSGKTQEFMKGRLLRRISKPKYIPYLSTYIQDYQDYTITESYTRAVMQIYNEAKKFSNNAAAPDFELLDENGDTTQLSDFKGKVVYLSFWASWCQPCLKEMSQSISNRVALQDTNVVFLYLSVDDSVEKWKRGIQKVSEYKVSRDFHVYAGGRKSEVSKAYRVISLPQYFLIDKDGSFITNFEKASGEHFVEQIQGVMSNE